MNLSSKLLIVALIALLLLGSLTLWIYIKISSPGYMDLNKQKNKLSSFSKEELFAEYLKNEKCIEAAMRKALRDSQTNDDYKKIKREVLYRRELSEIIIQLL